MYKQKTIESLVMLIQVALGTKPSNVQQVDDLKTVYNLARWQEVSAIALDGLQKLSTLEADILQDEASVKVVKMQWIGSMMHQERGYRVNFAAAKELSELYDNHQIYTYVLKGFSISEQYPVPSHRFSCDLDCFLLSQAGSFDAYNLGNTLVASKGCKVDDEYYKHSVFAYKGLTVENHRYCCSVKRSKRTKELESYLVGMLKDYHPLYITDTKLALPPTMFQALFMMEHANGHFLYSKMSLKHVCDWAMLRKAFKDTLDWEEFDKQCKRFGLKNFADCMNRLADYVIGTCTFNELQPIDKRVLEDTFKEVRLSPQKMKQRIEKAMGVLQSSWKFKHFCSDSMMKELTHSVWAYLKEDKPELD